MKASTHHSITFGTKNTWKDWKLVAPYTPVVAPPDVKKRNVEIPGRLALLDLTTAIPGYPVYGNRSGTFELYLYDKTKNIYSLANEIMTYFRGKKLKMVLEDEPENYYEGRFSVSSIEPPSDKHGVISIDYMVYPYKRMATKSTEDWLWDTFSFDTGVILTSIFKNIEVTNSTKRLVFTSKDFGSEPVSPKFIVTTSDRVEITLKTSNPKQIVSKTLKNGTHSIPEFVFCNDQVEMTMYAPSGTATVSIEFSKGRL